MQLTKRPPLTDPLKKPILSENWVKVKSFNEPDVEIDYEEVGHTYQYNGKKFVGVTSFIKKFCKEFKLDTVAKICAKNWGVPAQAVIDLWASNGKVSSEFGTAIHNAIEYYELNKDFGQAVADTKGDEDNYALPKHPILKKIILDFIKINPVAGKVLTEQLITNKELGICGRADRIVIIDEANKVCKIGDYKVNVDSDVIKSESKLLSPFEGLPANKISKYQLQMSIYANMLQKSGWTVQGLDVYVLEDEWLHYELPVLEVI